MADEQTQNGEMMFFTEEVQMRSQAQNNTQGNMLQGQYQQGN